MQRGQPRLGTAVLVLVLLLIGAAVWRPIAAQSAQPKPQTPRMLAIWGDPGGMRVAAVDQTRQDMDTVVSTKGVPLHVEDLTIGGAVRRA
jgi:hypothetical protein